jgi:hypothetical protein
MYSNGHAYFTILKSKGHLLFKEKIIFTLLMVLLLYFKFSEGLEFLTPHMINP